MIFKKPEYTREDLIREFYEEGKQQDFRDRVHLETERIFAGAWVDVCKNLQNFPKQQVDEFESLIKQGIEMQWGPCDVVFCRDKYTIVAKARDGKCMELVSGDIYESEVV